MYRRVNNINNVSPRLLFLVSEENMEESGVGDGWNGGVGVRSCSCFEEVSEEAPAIERNQLRERWIFVVRFPAAQCQITVLLLLLKRLSFLPRLQWEIKSGEVTAEVIRLHLKTGASCFLAAGGARSPQNSH